MSTPAVRRNHLLVSQGSYLSSFKHVLVFTRDVSQSAARNSPSPNSAKPNSSLKPTHHPENSSLPSFSLWAQIHASRPVVRYTVYSGLALVAIVETTFWFNVIKSNFFRSEDAEDRERERQFRAEIGAAVRGYREVYVKNYGRYYGSYIWGVGYRGLDAVSDEVK